MSFESKKHRFEILSRVQPKEPPLTQIIANMKRSRAGSYQRVWEWGAYVVKEVFSDVVIGTQTGKPAERRESMRQSKLRLERHLQFLRSVFSDLYPRARCFVVNDRGKFRLFKVQRNLRVLKQYGPGGQLGTGNDFHLLSALHDTKNEKLREDFKKLYLGWKFLRDNGVSLDVTFTNNATLCYEGEGPHETLRLKIYDSIPLVLLDEGVLKRSTLPQDLITTSVLDMDNRNPQNIEEFWSFVEDWYQRILPTYRTEK